MMHQKAGTLRPAALLSLPRCLIQWSTPAPSHLSSPQRVTHDHLTLTSVAGWRTCGADIWDLRRVGWFCGSQRVQRSRLKHGGSSNHTQQRSTKLRHTITTESFRRSEQTSAFVLLSDMLTVTSFPVKLTAKWNLLMLQVVLVESAFV